ncbi:MAG: twin-arginine translocase TatA/TatE family subunit [Magnetococcales bacterium]|nr:twin-arginine translocase TatA/TatE family subunit [Magnetococcales bacterium]
MLGMGWVEIFIIVIVALVVIGPDKLPEVARGLAKGLRQVQRLVGEVRDTINLDEFDQKVRQEMDQAINPMQGSAVNPPLEDHPHPDFKDFDRDIEEEPSEPEPTKTVSLKKTSDDRQP